MFKVLNWALKQTTYNIRQTWKWYSYILPIFGIIEDIVLFNDNLVIFKCKLTNTIAFDDHVFSYEVKVDDECTFVYHLTLFSYIPNKISVLSNGCSYVTLRSSI